MESLFYRKKKEKIEKEKKVIMWARGIFIQISLK